jgi:hypothetical protein
MSYDAEFVPQMSHEIICKRVISSEIVLTLTTLKPDVKDAATKRLSHDMHKNGSYIFYILLYVKKQLAIYGPTAIK